MEATPSHDPRPTDPAIEADHAKHGSRPGRGVWLACSICQREVPEPRPRVPAAWPKLAKAIAMFRTPTDTGLGDTIANNLNRIPAFKGMGAGDAFKKVLHAMGIECGCDSRQRFLNERYPYG